MNVKIQSSGIAGEPNNRSSRGYIEYLGHENREKIATGNPGQTIPLYDSNGNPVEPSAAIAALDSNKFHLGKNDAKFYSIIFSFSEEEIMCMGNTRERRLQAAHQMVGQFMDRYATGFSHDDIGSHKDLLYFYTIHEHRGKEEKDSNNSSDLHIHVAVSRNDIKQKHKLSPVTTYRKGSATGVISHGFCRDDFFRDCEVIFDREFSYNRKLTDSYEYYNTMKNGTTEQREQMTERVIDGMHVTDDVYKALSVVACRLADEADSEEGRKVRAQIERDTPKDKKRRNEFWNSYYSYYRPQLQNLRDLIGSAFNLYSEAKEKYGIEDNKVHELRQILGDIYDRMNQDKKRISLAKTSKALVNAVATAFITVQPVTALIISLTISIIANNIIKNAKKERHALYNRAKEIRKGMTEILEYSEELKNTKNDRLKEYVNLKTDRDKMKSEIEQLRKHLDDTADKKEKMRKLASLLTSTKLSSRKEEVNSNNTALDISKILMTNKSLLYARVDLENCGYNIEPILHPNGGVADFKLEHSGETCIAKQCLSKDDFMNMLCRWYELTGQKPAFLVEQENKMQHITEEEPIRHQSIRRTYHHKL